MFRLTRVQARRPLGAFRRWASTTPPTKPRRSFFAQAMRTLGIVTVGGAAIITGAVIQATWLPEQQPVDKGREKLVILGSGWATVGVLTNLDTSLYDVTVVSPRNYFLYTPLLPSCATGLVEIRSLMEPTRQILRRKNTLSTFIEGEAFKVDPHRKTVAVKVNDRGEGIPTAISEIPYDKLVIGVGSDVATFGIPGIHENACFMKEVEDAQSLRKRIMDCVEAASFPGIDPEVRKRLLHTVVVGGGPTGVEVAGEIHDFFEQDLRKLNPPAAEEFKVTLVEALPSVLSSFTKNLIDYTRDTLEAERIDVLTKTMVKKVTEDTCYADRTLPTGEKQELQIPYGVFIWAGGNAVRPVVKDLFSVIPEQNTARRGLFVDEYLRVKGTDDIWAVGDCAVAGLAPTAQAASQEGLYIGNFLNKRAQRLIIEDSVRAETDPEKQKKLQSKFKRVAIDEKFQYTHHGALAYIGAEKAVADLSFLGIKFSLGGTGTYFFWRGAYLSYCLSLRNRLLVALDWIKVKVFGRDVSRE